MLGDTTPTQPLPPAPQNGGGCGVVGQILVVVAFYTAGAVAGLLGSGSVATSTGAAAGGALGSGTSGVVSAAVGGAVGSAASQGVAIAIGQQQGFSWGAVALAAVGAGVTAGLAGSSTWRGVLERVGPAAPMLNSAVNSTLTQGIGVLTGVQQHFSWKDVAASALAAPVAGAVGRQAARASKSSFVGQVAAGVSGAQVRSVFGGKVDTAFVLADAFGNALGNSIVDAMRGPPTAMTRLGAQGGGTTSGEISAKTASGSAGHTASLSNNPTDAIYQPGMAPTPDKLRVMQAGDPSSIGGVLVTAPTWKPGEERIYQQLINSSIFGWGGPRDEDRTAAQAQSIYNHDIRVQHSGGSPLPAIVKAIGNQLIQPVLQVADLGLVGRGLVQNKVSDWAGGRVPSFDAASYFVSDVGAVAARGGGIAETLPVGLQSSTLGSVGYYSSRATANVIEGNYAAAAADAGAVALNFIGAKGVSSAPALLRQIDLVGSSGGIRLAGQEGVLNLGANLPVNATARQRVLASIAESQAARQASNIGGGLRAEALQLSEHNFNRLIENRGLPAGVITDIRSTFDGPVFARHGVVGDPYLVTETAIGTASGRFVTRGSAGATPDIRRQVLALPDTNLALVESPVAIGRAHILLEGRVAAQPPYPPFGPHATGGGWQILTDDGFRSGALLRR